MKMLLLILTLIIFLQASVLPVNLILIILILKNFLRPEKENLYLAMTAGLLLSFLTNTHLGIYSLVFLILSSGAQIVARSRLGDHILIALGLIATSLIIFKIVDLFVLGQSIQIWPESLVEILLSIPLYFLAKLWEERFIIKPDIKLKL